MPKIKSITQNERNEMNKKHSKINIKQINKKNLLIYQEN